MVSRTRRSNGSHFSSSASLDLSCSVHCRKKCGKVFRQKPDFAFINTVCLDLTIACQKIIVSIKNGKVGWLGQRVKVGDKHLPAFLFTGRGQTDAGFEL